MNVCYLPPNVLLPVKVEGREPEIRLPDLLSTDAPLLCAYCEDIIIERVRPVSPYIVFDDSLPTRIHYSIRYSTLTYEEVFVEPSSKTCAERLGYSQIGINSNGVRRVFHDLPPLIPVKADPPPLIFDADF